MHKKRGIFFTIDSILAAGIFFIILILVSTSYISQSPKVHVSFMSQDIVRVFTNIKVSELDNDYVKTLIQEGKITRLNSTILEQIGEFWAEDQIDLAKNFTKSITDSLIPGRFGLGVYVDGDEIYSRNKSITRNLISSRKIISGIEKDKPIEGFASKAGLTGIKSKTTNAYTYFGGFEGEGNLIKRIVLPNDVIDIINATLEAEPGGDFDLYINGLDSGSYAKGSAGGGAMLADKFSIDENYYENFENGINFFTINFTGLNPFIAGGFLKVRYTTSEINDTLENDNKRYWLPGINGFINYYGSVYSAGNLENMEIYLDFFSNYTTFMKIGNTTVYNNNTNGSTTAFLDNSTLADIFAADGISYSDLSKKALPVRLGIVNVSSKGNADVMLVTDVSGSMQYCTSGGGTVFACTDWWDDTLHLRGERWVDTITCERKVDVYKDASNIFADIILNISGNKIGLVEYTKDDGGCHFWFGNFCYVCEHPSDCGWNWQPPNCIVPFPDSIARTNDLTTDLITMKNVIDTTETWWGTCTCCGINKAVEILNEQSSVARNKSLVVMSDGEANVICAEQGTGNAKQDAIQAAQDACGQGISVFTIGFGADIDASALQDMACGGGTYNDATDTSELEEVYKEIAGEIIELTYETQQPSVTLTSHLNPTSYIQLNYSEVSSLVFGKIPLSFETDRFGNNITTGILTIPEETTIFDAKVTSYSGDKWTDNFVVNTIQVYKLTDYNDDYSVLGDPYIVNIPVENLNTGTNNLIISTGISPTNNTGGSLDDRAIYTLLINAFSDFSAVVAKSEGCNWNVRYEDSTTDSITIPTTYSKNDICYYENATYEQDDAMDIVIYNLFENLDVDKDGLLDLKISEGNFNIETLTISKVPSLWGPAIVEVRVWE